MGGLEFCKHCNRQRDCWFCEKLEDWVREHADIEGDLISREAAVQMLREKAQGYVVSLFATSSDCKLAREIAMECAEAVRQMEGVEAGQDTRILIDLRSAVNILDTEGPAYGSAAAFQRVLERVPRVDAEPVRHGRWIKNGDDDMWHCLECGHEIDSDLALIEEMQEQGCALFCEHCGAKMDKEAKK